MKTRLRNPYNWFLALLATFSLLPILAPLFMKLSESSEIWIAPAKFIYFLYSFTCHQFASRSIHLFDYQLAWCARDTGIWLSLLVVALLVRRFRLKGLSWYWVIPFVIPIAMDGGIQTVTTALNISPVGIAGAAAYISTNLIRFVTGSLFGMAVSLWLAPLLADSFDPIYADLRKRKLLRGGWAQARIIIVTFMALFAFYVGIVGLWDVTSVNNRPSDWLDAAVKTPAVDFYTRRADGACPTSGTDLFNTDCFLGR